MIKPITAFTFLYFITTLTDCCGQVLNFDLRWEGSSYKGVVEPQYFDSLVLEPSKKLPNQLLNATGVLYNSEHGSFDFTIVENIFDNSNDLMFKVIFGWFPITDISFTDDSLSFSWDWDFRPTPNAGDLKILKRANEILSTEASWNNADDRKCEDDNKNKKWSLYCALYKASFDMIGDFNHRNSALGMVRTTIEELTPGKVYAHRLMDFNNQNTFKDIQQVLKRSIEKFENMPSKD